MKNTLQEFIPFEHKNVEYVNGSLSLARQQKQLGDAVNLMAAAVIYANLVEYLAKNLLENIQHMFYILSYKSLNGIFFIKDKANFKQRPKMLGQICDILGEYEFPDSVNFIKLLRQFSESRAAIFHKLLNVSNNDMVVIDESLEQMHVMAEEILDKYNSITQGIGNQWYVFVNTQNIILPPQDQPKLDLKENNKK